MKYRKPLGKDYNFLIQNIANNILGVQQYVIFISVLNNFNRISPIFTYNNHFSLFNFVQINGS